MDSIKFSELQSSISLWIYAVFMMRLTCGLAQICESCDHGNIMIKSASTASQKKATSTCTPHKDAVIHCNNDQSWFPLAMIGTKEKQF